MSGCAHRVVVDGTESHGIHVSSVLQESALGPLTFALYTTDMFDIVPNKLFDYADDATLRTNISVYSER